MVLLFPPYPFFCVPNKPYLGSIELPAPLTSGSVPYNWEGFTTKAADVGHNAFIDPNDDDRSFSLRDDDFIRFGLAYYF